MRSFFVKDCRFLPTKLRRKMLPTEMHLINIKWSMLPTKTLKNEL
jgi:hypothetical protein